MDFSIEELEELPEGLKVPVMLAQIMQQATQSTVAVQCIIHMCPERKENVMSYLVNDYNLTSKIMPGLKEALVSEQEGSLMFFMRDYVLDLQKTIDDYLVGDSSDSKTTH